MWQGGAQIRRAEHAQPCQAEPDQVRELLLQNLQLRPIRARVRDKEWQLDCSKRGRVHVGTLRGPLRGSAKGTLGRNGRVRPAPPPTKGTCMRMRERSARRA